MQRKRQSRSAHGIGGLALAGAWLALSPVAGACAETAHAARPSSAPGSAQTPAPYVALEPLIGEWSVGPPGAGPAFVERFSWGPKRAYIWASVALLVASGEEHPHFEGLVIWNAATRRFDYLFAVEPGSLIQEQGEFHVAEDGGIVRDVILTGADGSVGRYRQTFRALGDGRFETSLMRQTADGWRPNFPGSDRLMMVRRAG